MRPMQNGYRRAVVTLLAAVSLTVLLYGAILVLGYHQPLDRDGAVVLAVFLGLHAFALTVLTGVSPWPHLLRLLHPDEGPGNRDQGSDRD